MVEIPYSSYEESSDINSHSISYSSVCFGISTMILFAIIGCIQLFFYNVIIPEKEIDFTGFDVHNIHEYSVPSNIFETIAFSAITVPQSTRFPVLFNEWGKKFLNATKKPQLFLISENCSSFEGYPCHELPSDMKQILDESKGSKYYTHINLVVKRYESARFLLRTTNAHWISVITDDVMVNLDSIESMLKDQYQKGNPNTADFWFGNCIDVPWRYLQGGSGYIMSRRTSERFIKPEIGLKWIKNLNDADDIYVSQAIFMLGMSVKRGTSGRFIGHNLTREHFQILKSRRFQDLPICPHETHSRYCNPGMWPLKDVAFFHQGKLDETVEIYRSVAERNIPDYVYWFQKGMVPHLCKQK